MTATPVEGGAEAERCARCARPGGTGRARRHAGNGRLLALVYRWPEGPICSGCFAKAMEVPGVCDGCGVDRLLPGIGPVGQRWCTDCGGGLGDFTCTRCGREGWREHAGVCGRCVLRDRVEEILDDGTGRIRLELMPLAALVLGMKRPRSGIRWLSRPEPRDILRKIARGDVPLTHEGVHSLAPPKSSLYIRDLMVTAGILPPVDKFMFLFEQWWPAWLDTITDSEHRQVLRPFITWHYLRAFRAKIDARGELGHSSPQSARAQLRSTAAFLTGLASRGRTLPETTQADLDRVFAENPPHLHGTLTPFLIWAMRTRRMPSLILPTRQDRPATLITQRRRIELIRRIYDGDRMEPTDRVLALLVLLYAQPLARIQHLTVDDITTSDDGQLLIRLGDPATPVPAPFDQVIRQHVAARRNQMTAANATSPWLFPGRASGRPMHTASFRLRLHNLGIPNLTNRSRAIREMLRQAPAIIVAGMLGYSSTATEKIGAEYGVAWQHYAGHDRQPRRPPRLIE